MEKGQEGSDLATDILLWKLPNCLLKVDSSEINFLSWRICMHKQAVWQQVLEK